jgi:ferrous iron transport protein A
MNDTIFRPKPHFRHRAQAPDQQQPKDEIEVLFAPFPRKGRTPLRFCFAKSSVVTVFQEKGGAQENNVQQWMSDLREGEAAQVEAVTIQGSMGRRLLDLGLTEGTRVTCVQKAPSGDPTAYRIRGAVVALRKADADLVRTGPAEPALRGAERTALA